MHRPRASIPACGLTCILSGWCCCVCAVGSGYCVSSVRQVGRWSSAAGICRTPSTCPGAFGQSKPAICLPVFQSCAVKVLANQECRNKKKSNCPPRAVSPCVWVRVCVCVFVPVCVSSRACLHIKTVLTNECPSCGLTTSVGKFMAKLLCEM